MNIEERINKALFEPKPMQRAKARRIHPAEKTLREISKVLGIEPEKKH